MEAVCLDTHPHILLAEDDFELRELLRFSLTTAGYRVTCCANGREMLVHLLQPHAFDLILSDLCMPALSGRDALALLAHNKQLPPFILMTAFGEQQTHDSIRQLGAVASIDKPFDLDEMIELIHRNCRPQRRRDCLKGMEK